VISAFEDRHHAFPAPRPVPRSMDEQEGRHLSRACPVPEEPSYAHSAPCRREGQEAARFRPSVPCSRALTSRR
jgi:hypothetical protein